MHVPTTRVDDVDLLHRLASHLEVTLFPTPEPPGPRPAPPPGEDGAGPLLVAAERAPGGLRVGFLPLAGDPLVALRGFRAPSSWWCAGIAASGWGWSPAGPTAGWPVQVVHLVGREGDAVAVHRRPGTAPSASLRRGPAGAWAGLLDDHLRRVLALPTAPAPPSTIELWIARWLDALLGVALRGELTGARWSDLVAHHPAGTCPGPGPGRVGPTVEPIVDATDALAACWTWPALHLAARRGDPAPATLPPASARWMDQGLFARTVLAALPAPADALSDLAEVLNPPLARRLRLACGACDPEWK
jgi:hypothetical protein